MSALLFPLPESRAEVVRALILDDLSKRTSYVAPPCPQMQDQLARAAHKAQQRRFDDEARITAMGDL